MSMYNKKTIEDIDVAGKKVLVLGSGGASNTAVAVLEELGASVIVISRSGENHYGNLHLHADASVIVNATPVGMYPNTGISPVAANEVVFRSGIHAEMSGNALSELEMLHLFKMVSKPFVIF